MDAPRHRRRQRASSNPSRPTATTPNSTATPPASSTPSKSSPTWNSHWFFDNWVYHDRGLPDLSIVNVTPSQLESRNGLPSGWLVAVEVRNDGYAEAEVPVTVRSATSTETHMLRIPGRSSASTRIIFPGTPEQVQVNDGSVPETQTSIHTRQLVLPAH